MFLQNVELSLNYTALQQGRLYSSGHRMVEELSHNIPLHPLCHIPLHFLYSHIRSHEHPSPLSSLSKYQLYLLHMPDSTTYSFITSVRLKHGLIGGAPVHTGCLLYHQFTETSIERKDIAEFKKRCGLGQIISFFFFVGWDLRHQVLRPLLAYCTAPDDR
jgi:hypothetical protein